MNWEIPTEKIKVKVENGLVTLEGYINRFYQKEATENEVIKVIGVTSIINNLKIDFNRRTKLKKRILNVHLRVHGP